MPLEFLEFVTERRFLEIVPLGGFRKKRISVGGAIRFSGVCHKRADFRLRDIRWFSQSEDLRGRCHYIF